MHLSLLSNYLLTLLTFSFSILDFKLNESRESLPFYFSFFLFLSCAPKTQNWAHVITGLKEWVLNDNANHYF